MAMAANLKQLIQDFVVPEFRALQGELKRLDEKMDGVRIEMRSEFHRLDEKIDSLDKRLNQRMDGLNQRMDGVEKRIDGLERHFSGQFDSLQKQLGVAIEIHERLAALEAKVGH
jgi:chromosome segregation ATPase